MGLKVYLMVSRNKDNKSTLNFKERNKKILAYSEDECKIFKMFREFVNTGVPGEVCRLYKSVNDRNESKVRKAFLLKFISDEPDLTKIDGTLISSALIKDSALEHKWMFDFDSTDENKLHGFLIYLNDINIKYEVTKTPNGYAIVVEHGFNTNDLFEKFKDIDISLKRDDMLFVDLAVTP